MRTSEGRRVLDVSEIKAGRDGFLVPYSGRESERISRRMSRLEAAGQAVGPQEVRKRRFMGVVKVSWCEGGGCRGAEGLDGGR